MPRYLYDQHLLTTRIPRTGPRTYGLECAHGGFHSYWSLNSDQDFPTAPSIAGKHPPVCFNLEPPL